MVVWQDAMSGGRDWYITRVVNHHATENAVAPKSVTDNELMASIIRGYMVKASSKEEALLRYRVFWHVATVWSIAGGKASLPCQVPISRDIYGTGSSRRISDGFGEKAQDAV